MEKVNNIDYLHKFPLDIRDYEYDRLSEKIKNNTLDQKDLNLLLHVVDNARFWKKKYRDINESVWSIVNRNHERI